MKMGVTNAIVRLGLRMLLVAGLLSGCGERAPQLKSGDPALPFETQALDGRHLRFPADFTGKVVAIRFWADWCPFCKDEMTAIEPIYRQHRDAGLEVIAINVGQSRPVAQRFIDKIPISYTIGLDEESAVARRYGVIGLPTTFFIDRDGKVRHKILGESEAETFARAVRELL